MQDERHGLTQELRGIRLKKRGRAHHCKSSNLQDLMEARQPEVA